MNETIKTNLSRIKLLIKDYYDLSDGALIENAEELLPIFAITNKGHIHFGYTVYISRKTLKHFVERRKIELIKKNTRQEKNH